MVEINFGAYFDKQAEKFGSKELMRFTGNDSFVSYRDVKNKSNQIANILSDLGVEKGGIVSVLMPNQIEWSYLFTGIIKAGCVANFINYKFEEELEFVLNNCESQVIFISDCFIKKFNGVVDKLKYIKKIVVFKNTNPSFDVVPEKLDDSRFKVCEMGELMAGSSSKYKNDSVKLSDSAILVYTSGSTGMMKGVILTNGNILAQIEILRDTIPFTGEDKYLCQQPLFYLDYAFYYWLVIEKGGSAVVMEKFTSSGFWDVVEKYRPTFLNSMPTMLNILMKTEESMMKEKIDSLKYISCCGEILQPETISKWEAKFPGKIYDTYTITEISCCGTVTPFGKRKVGSVGIAHTSNQVGIMDDNLKLLGPNMVGEVCTKGPCVMKEYWRNPELTSKTIIDGWYHSNDLGYYDEEGYFFIVGRKNSIINKGGEKVSAVELENIIKKIDGVENCVVLGVPDKIMGYEIAVLVETKSDLKADFITDYCKKKIAKFKIPRYIRFVSELPKLNTGKVDRQAIAKIFLDDLLK